MARASMLDTWWIQLTPMVRRWWKFDMGKLYNHMVYWEHHGDMGKGLYIPLYRVPGLIFGPLHGFLNLGGSHIHIVFHVECCAVWWYITSYMYMYLENVHEIPRCAWTSADYISFVSCLYHIPHHMCSILFAVEEDIDPLLLFECVEL